MKKTIWTLVAVGLMSVLLTAGALVLTGCEKKEAAKTTGNGASAEATADSADTETKTTSLYSMKWRIPSSTHRCMWPLRKVTFRITAST